MKIYMKIKFILMAFETPERLLNIEILKNNIPNLEVYLGDNDDIFIKYLNCFKIDSSFDGVVVLEDDILLCKDFYSKILDVISKNKDVTISFFEKPNSKKELITKMNSGYEFMFNQCNYYPKNICDLLLDDEEIIHFKSNYFKKHKIWKAPIDLYIGDVLGRNKIKYLMNVPFLVQHLDFKSTLGNRSTNRQTKYFIDDL